MTDNRRPSDEQLLEYLKDSLDHSVEASDDAIDMLMTGYDIVHTDVVDAELTFDSFELAGVRAERPGYRQLRYEHGPVHIDIELDDLAQRCWGSVRPPGGSLALEQVSGVRSLDLSGSGSFNTVVEGVGPFRLSYVVDDTTVATDWLQFGTADT